MAGTLSTGAAVAFGEDVADLDLRDRFEVTMIRIAPAYLSVVLSRDELLAIDLAVVCPVTDVRHENAVAANSG